MTEDMFDGLIQMNDKWVIACYYPIAPCDIYGVFDSEEEALEYARDCFQSSDCRYIVHPILDAEEYLEDPNDYVGMGWVDDKGRP